MSLALSPLQRREREYPWGWDCQALLEEQGSLETNLLPGLCLQACKPPAWDLPPCRTRAGPQPNCW